MNRTRVSYAEWHLSTMFVYYCCTKRRRYQHHDLLGRETSLMHSFCLSCHASPRPAGTLPPSFTQLIVNRQRRPPSSRYGISRPATTSVTSILAKAAAGRARVDNSVAPGADSNDGSRTNISLSSRKRPRTSPFPEKRHSSAGINGSLSPQLRSGTSAFAVAGGEGGTRANGVGDARSGGLWGSTGLPPAGVLHPGRNRMHLETEWACPSSSVATSTTSFHDEFSDVSFKRPFSHLGEGGRGGGVIEVKCSLGQRCTQSVCSVAVAVRSLTRKRDA